MNRAGVGVINVDSAKQSIPAATSREEDGLHEAREQEGGARGGMPNHGKVGKKRQKAADKAIVDAAGAATQAGASTPAPTTTAPVPAQGAAGGDRSGIAATGAPRGAATGTQSRVLIGAVWGKQFSRLVEHQHGRRFRRERTRGCA